MEKREKNTTRKNAEPMYTPVSPTSSISHITLYHGTPSSSAGNTTNQASPAIIRTGLNYSPTKFGEENLPVKLQNSSFGGASSQHQIPIPMMPIQTNEKEDVQGAERGQSENSKLSPRQTSTQNNAENNMEILGTEQSADTALEMPDKNDFSNNSSARKRKHSRQEFHSESPTKRQRREKTDNKTEDMSEDDENGKKKDTPESDDEESAILPKKTEPHLDNKNGTKLQVKKKEEGIVFQTMMFQTKKMKMPACVNDCF